MHSDSSSKNQHYCGPRNGAHHTAAVTEAWTEGRGLGGHHRVRQANPERLVLLLALPTVVQGRPSYAASGGISSPASRGGGADEDADVHRCQVASRCRIGRWWQLKPPWVRLQAGAFLLGGRTAQALRPEAGAQKARTRPLGHVVATWQAPENEMWTTHFSGPFPRGQGSRERPPCSPG